MLRLRLPAAYSWTTRQLSGGAVFLDTYGVRPSRLSNVIMARNTATMGSALVGKQVQMVNATVARNHGTALALGTRDRMEHLAIRLSNTILTGTTAGTAPAAELPIDSERRPRHPVW